MRLKPLFKNNLCQAQYAVSVFLGWREEIAKISVVYDEKYITKYLNTRAFANDAFQIFKIYNLKKIVNFNKMHGSPALIFGNYKKIS
jgi:hypothetical protein